MRGLRQLGSGLLLAILSVLIIVGGMSLALAEGYVLQPPLTPTATRPAATSAPTDLVTASPPTATETPTVTASPPPPANCLPPPGWILVMILPGDTLDILAARYQTSPAALVQANCLTVAALLPGYGIYVPAPAIPPTFTPIPCGPPFGWIQIVVQPGDTLYRIAALYGVTVTQLKQANCLVSDFIGAGQRLWVPNVATLTPSATPIQIEFPTSTLEPSATIPPSATLEPTVFPTETPLPPTETPPPPTETPSLPAPASPTP